MAAGARRRWRLNNQAGYCLPRLHKSGFFPRGRPAIQQLIEEIADLIRAGVLETSAGKRFGLEQWSKKILDRAVHYTAESGSASLPFPTRHPRSKEQRFTSSSSTG